MASMVRVGFLVNDGFILTKNMILFFDAKLVPSCSVDADHRLVMAKKNIKRLKSK